VRTVAKPTDDHLEVRPVRRVVLALVVIATCSFMIPDAALAAENTCDLITKKQATKILGFKVVKTEFESEASSGAEQCSYRTKKYWKPRFKKLGAPLKLNITTQPLTEEAAVTLDELEADPEAQSVPGLGDRAFYTDGNDLVVVVGDLVLQAEVTNIEWKGDERQKYILDPELAAMRVLVPLFTDVSK
jgi:hypothetical protein